MVNLLFDYDGTLHDSLRIYAPAVQAAYDRLAGLGYAAPRTWEPEELRGWIGLSPQEMWEGFLPGLPQAAKDFSRGFVGARMLALIRAGRARLYPGVPQLLAALRGAGFRLLLLSSCPRSYLQAHSWQFGLEAWFDGLYCGEEFHYRPKHEIVPELQTRHQGSFLVIGDRRQDVEAARKNGLPSVGCRYGYGGPGELDQADRAAETPAQLLSCIRSLVPGPIPASGAAGR